MPTNIFNRPNIRKFELPSIKKVENCKFIPGSYKAVLLDQFGVLHDGHKPYPWAPKAVEYLAKSNVKVMIISNSSRRSTSMFENLEKMGFDRNWFYDGVTSGDVVHQILKSREDSQSEYNSLGNKCCYMTWATRSLNKEPNQCKYDPPEILPFNIQVERQLEKADFILASGMEGILKIQNGEYVVDLFTSEELIEELKTMYKQFLNSDLSQKKQIPMLLGNPDKVTLSGDKLLPMPGTLGVHYQQLGGKVIPMGKPGKDIYNLCCQKLGEPFENILAVGDSLEFDILGAASQNIDSLLIEDGVHGEHIKSIEDIHKLSEELGSPIPQYTTPIFSV